MTTGPVGEGATRIVPGTTTTVTYPFVFEPIGIAYSAGSGRLYIANRGNGSIIAIDPDAAVIESYDTGLGGDSLNGIDAIYSGAIDSDILFLTNTASTSDPSSSDPAYGMGTLEKAVIALSPAP
jgi:DNA-binding beta-propeller fold protein YncE